VTIKYGISLHPEWHRLLDAAIHWPTIADSTLITEGDASLLSNVTTALIAGELHATTVTAYLVLCWAAAVVAIVLPFAMRIHSASFARYAFIIIAGGALAPVLLAWVGGYDAVVAIAAIVGGLSRRKWLSSVGWLVLGFSHSAVAVAALLLWLPLAWVSEREADSERLRRAVLATLSVALGWFAIRTLTDAWGGSTDRFALYRSIDPGAIVTSYLSAAPLVLFGAVGVGWLLFLDKRLWQLRSTRTMLVVAIVAAVALPLVAVDQTRILALALVAATMRWIDDASTHVDLGATSEDRRVWRTWALAAAIVPIPVVWMGSVLYPGWGGIGDLVALLRG
jgi:hypothetical protein